MLTCEKYCHKICLPSKYANSLFQPEWVHLPYVFLVPSQFPWWIFQRGTQCCCLQDLTRLFPSIVFVWQSGWNVHSHKPEGESCSWQPTKFIKLISHVTRRIHWKFGWELPLEEIWGLHNILQGRASRPFSTVVGVTPLQSPENGSPDFSYFIHAQVTWSYHPPTSWNVWRGVTLSSNLNASSEDCHSDFLGPHVNKYIFKAQYSPKQPWNLRG
jgi:hypothetical protein